MGISFDVLFVDAVDDFLTAFVQGALAEVPRPAIIGIDSSGIHDAIVGE